MAAVTTESRCGLQVKCCFRQQSPGIHRFHIVKFFFVANRVLLVAHRLLLFLLVAH